MLTVAVLGPVELRRDGVLLPVPAGRTTELLVRLALDAGRPVRAERLIEDLWSDQAAGVTPNTLQSKVSMLRRVLGDPGLLTSDGSGYTLGISGTAVDALEVLRLAGSAASLREAGDAAGAARVAAAGLGLFRGEVLPGGGDAEWVLPHRARLEEARLRLTEDELAARLELGATGELVGELQALVAVHPVQEGLWHLLITALYRSGRQADALAAYRQVQQHLADELGLDPGPQLQALEQQVLHHDRTLDAPRVPARIPEHGRTGNLPGVSSSIIGRGADLTAVTGLIHEHRLVTITGPAGVGKTRLAVEAARDEVAGGVAPARGAWLVRLESARPGEPLWPVLGEVFSLSAATQEMLLDRLHGADLLLVLDNCEHLGEPITEAVARVLEAAPEVRILATSQVPLGVDGEWVHPLEPLPLADSVALFTLRATQQRRSFAPDPAGATAIEAVCRALDGLPLAIELAAARAKALSVQEIARRLGDRFALLRDPGGHRAPRQRTLASAIAWSYDLLFPDDQRGLWALACFSGGAPLGAVEQVLGVLGVPGPAALDVVDRLVDRSLVIADVEADGGARYRLLDSVREFSAQRSAAAGMAEVAAGAHAAWFAAAADEASGGIRTRDQARHLRTARAERANVDAALVWCGSHDPVLGLRIAYGFGWAWAVLGTGPEGALRLRAAVNAAGAAAPADQRATALLYASWLEAAGGDLGLAAADLKNALAGADDDLQAVAAVYLAFLRTQQGRPADVLAVLRDVEPALFRTGRIWEAGGSCLLRAWAHTALGESAAAGAACREAQRIFTELGDDWALIHTAALLGGYAEAEQRFADAITELERAVSAADALGFDAALALHLASLGRVQGSSGDPEAAASTLRRAITAGRAAGDLRLVAQASARLGQVLLGLGDLAAAWEVVQPAHDWFVRAGGGEGSDLAEAILNELAARAGSDR